MAEEVLKIKITADNSEAVAALKNTETAATNVSAAFKRQQESLKGVQAQTLSTIVETKKLDLTLGDLKEKYKNLKASMDFATDPARFAALRAEAIKTTAAIKEMEAAGGGGGIVAGASNAYSVVRKLAYILPGIGIAGLFNVAFEGIAKAAEALGVFNSKLTDTQKASKALDDVYKNSNKQAGEELVNMRLLASAASDHSIAIDKRIQAAKQLKEQYPEYLKNISQETLLNGGAKVALDELTKSIIDNARAKAAATKIGELEAQKLDLQIKKAKEYEDATKRISEAKGVTVVGGQGGSSFISAETQQRDIKGLAEARMRGYDNEVNSLSKQQSLITSIIGSRKLELSVIDDIKTKVGKESTLIPFIKPASWGNVAASHKYEGDVASVYGQEAKDLKLMADALQRVMNLEKTRDFLKVQNPVAAQKNYLLAEYEQKQAQKEYERISNQKYLVQLQQDFNEKLAKQQSLADGIGNSFAHLFSNLAKSKNPFETLTNAVKQLVIDLAAAVAKMLIIKAIMAIINPAGSAAKGIGAIIGGVIGGVPAHAKGGVTNGASIGMIGEAGPEAIIPLDKLSGFIDRAASIGAERSQSGGQMGQGEFVLRGNDLVLAMQRSNYSLNLRRG